MVTIKKQNGQEALFIVWEGQAENIIKHADKNIGRLVEIESHRDLQRGGLEMVRAIRVFNRKKSL